MNTEISQKETANRTVKLGFLGIGWIGLNRMNALLNAGIAEAYAISDVNVENAVNAATNNTVICSSFEKMLEIDSLDGIVIATPSALHAAQTIAALDAGFAVFCQKPLGRDCSEVTSVLETARRNDKLLGVDLSYRFLNVVNILHMHIKQGLLGQIFGVEAVFHNAYGPDKAWFYDANLSGGGCVIDLGIHLVDLILCLLDSPGIEKVESSLYSNGTRLRGRCNKVEDYAVATIDLENSCTVRLACSWNLQAGCDAVIKVTFYGTKSALSIQNVNGSFYDFSIHKNNKTSREMLYDAPDDWGGKAIVDWANKLKTDASFDKSIFHIKKVAEVIDLIYENS